MSKIISYLKNLNIYKTSNENTIEIEHNEILATRIFLVLFVLSLTSLVGYSSLTLQLTKSYISSPTQAQFEYLQLMYPETLVCPCSHLSIPLNRLTSVEIQFHQICSSQFVDKEWISSISNRIPQIYYSLDIRRILSSQLQLLSSFCELAKLVHNLTLTTLSSDQFIISSMISFNRFYLEINALIHKALNTTKTEVNQTRQLIHSIGHVNQLASGLGTNYLYRTQDNGYTYYSIVRFLKDQNYPPPIVDPLYTTSDLCSCILSDDCIYPSGIYPNLTGVDSYYYYVAISPLVVSLVQIPGLYIGCTPLNSLLKSNLQCFYDSQCLTYLFNRTDIEPLNNQIESSNYSLNTRIETLVEQLFIENMKINYYFNALYDECKPILCSYSYNSKGTITFIFLTVLSLIGGLSVVLKVLATYLVKLIEIIKRKFRKQTNTTNQNSSFLVRKFFDDTHQTIRELNLFENPSSDESQYRNEILSTRIYLLLMFVSIIVISFYASIIEHTFTYHVPTPSIEQYSKLYSKYPDLICECTQITVSYIELITFQPEYHPICYRIYNSELFRLSYARDLNIINLSEFSFTVAASVIPLAAQTICTFTSDAASQAINTYLETVYVSRYLTSQREFQNRFSLSVNNFISSAPIMFNQLLQLITDTTQGNNLLSGSFINAQLVANRSTNDIQNRIDIIDSNFFHQTCLCGVSSEFCEIPYDEYCNYTYSWFISCLTPMPGVVLACSVMNTLLQSNIQCLFKWECITPVIESIAYWTNISTEIISQLPLVLNGSNLVAFSINSTVYDIVNALSINKWNEQIHYESYYKACQPSYCMYTITTRFHIATIITTIIGLMGGVSVILQLVIPSTVKIIRRRFRIQFKNQYLKELNFFKTFQTNQSMEIQRNEIIATRIYIFLWLIAIIVILIYMGSAEKTVTITVDSPTINQIKQLKNKNPMNQFVCPCQKNSISFQSFLSFDFTFHQICSSDLISTKWLEHTFIIGNEHLVNQSVLSSHFKLLQLFCHSLQKNLLNMKNNFYVNQFTTVNLLNEQEFFKQTQVSIEQFQEKTKNSFIFNLKSLIDITLGNQFMSTYQTNWEFIPSSIDDHLLNTQAKFYRNENSNNCSCVSTKASTCCDSLIINQNTTITGMMIGCLPLTSLRLSTLECFYDRICFQQILNTLNLSTTTISIEILNSTQSSRFMPNTTLDIILDNLMLEQWFNYINYTAYFDECNPQECTYSINKRNNFLFVFSTLLGLYGGITVILRFVAPILVTIGRKIWNRKIVPQAF